MKAVIMAGGKGTRLRPLTSGMPKPMVPLLDRPCMGYAIDLLARHGVADIAVTLQYMPEAIRSAFGDGEEYGVRLHYAEEEMPLGTAGSVKNAEEFLDEPFFVISGDAVTDFDLSEALAYHRSVGSMATLVLTRVESPLEFGVVMTDADGRVTRFLEKPSWGEVFSDTINTGIYLLEPEIFSYIERGQVCDFAKDLFPRLLAEGKPMYGYVAEGYWSDIGNAAQYKQTQFDLLSGAVRLPVPGREIAPGIRVGEGARVDEAACLTAPVYIGPHAVIEAGAAVGPYGVIGEGSRVHEGAVVEQGILWTGVHLGRGAEVNGAMLCRGASLGSGAVAHEGAVIGDGCRIGEKSVIQAGVRIFPRKTIGSYAVLTQSLIWGDAVSRGLFGYAGVRGTANVDMTTGFANKLALAFGSQLPAGSTFAVSHDASPFSYLLAEAFASGLHAAGQHTCHLGNVTSSVARYAAGYYGTAGGVHVRQNGDRSDAYLIEFLGEDGLPISKGTERKIENGFHQEDFRLVSVERLGRRFTEPNARILYRDHLLEALRGSRIREMQGKVVVQYDSRNLQHILPELLEALGCTVIQVNRTAGGHVDIAKLVLAYEADFGVLLDPGAERIELITEKGEHVRDERVSLLQMLIQVLCENRKQLHVPVHLPDTAERIGIHYGREVVRTKADQRTVMEGCAYDGYHVFFDGLYTLVRIMEMMAMQGRSLSQLLAQIPDFTLLIRQVECPWSEKGRVMRHLMEETKGKQVELIDGIKVFHDIGWTLILPDSDEPTFRIFASADNVERAEEQAQRYSRKIGEYYGNGRR